MAAGALHFPDSARPPTKYIERWGIADEAKLRREIAAASTEELDAFTDELMKDRYNAFFAWIGRMQYARPPLPPDHAMLFPVARAFDLACIESERRFVKPTS